MHSRFIRSFKSFPRDLFRVSSGRMTKLREWSPQQRHVYDIVTEAGIVKAKALDPTTYSAPNGASMRPNTDFQRRLIQKIRGPDAVVFSVPSGTQLPKDLLLVHEYGDHYSLQAARDMPLQELNSKITSFLEAYGNVKCKEAWLRAFSP